MPESLPSPSHALERPTTAMKGVGPKLAEHLLRMGVERIGDLLCLLPIRYEDRTEIRPLGGLKPGEKVLVEGKLELAEVVFRHRRSLLCRISDGTGAIVLRFFHFRKAQQQTLSRGVLLRCFGSVRAGPTGLEMIHPEYKILMAGSEPLTNVMTPIYPTTEGLQQQRLRRLTQQAVDILEHVPLTDYLRGQLPEDWPTLNQALRFLHGPPQGCELDLLLHGTHPCQRRMALEELVAQRLSLRQLNIRRTHTRAMPLKDVNKLVPQLRSQLPFVLTSAQETALDDILSDVATVVPMHRLLQGDVGSGKTIVAAIAALVSASAGSQTGFMAPTELLVEQHFGNLCDWLRPLGIEVVRLTGTVMGPARSKVLSSIAAGQAQVVVGTHALFQQGVQFRKLALMIVDEQHRFGVHQRLKLKQKGQKGVLSPHQLVMTATPIPRTLAMTAYADLDCSIIDELPPGRQPVQTAVVPESRRPQLIQRVLAHCRAGRQAYWVCPLIEESEVMDSQAAAEVGRELELALPELAVGLIHGRMRSQEKDAIMRRFKEGGLDLLVATTVIEVGVDVTNASLMIIENSERMGLSQLHQLRGRVGRGSEASSCVLLYKSPLSEVAQQRLRVIRETSDGFLVAQKDLELRGPGEVLGTRQAGIMHLKVADLVRDSDLLPQVIKLSDELLEKYPQRVPPLIRRWASGTTEYAKV
ncbi:MAG: ATP-dependent DNA helicase RecG [Pseudomonadota bacterium]|nr:ATP-dependent DNA helicase RecG [Pseudomonadota bacterium]